MCRKLVEAGWKLDDIEEAEFELLTEVMSNDQKKKQKQVSLNDFLKKGGS